MAVLPASWDRLRTADLPAPVFQQVCKVNQFGVFLGMRAVLPGMVQAGGGINYQCLFYLANVG